MGIVIGGGDLVYTQICEMYTRLKYDIKVKTTDYSVFLVCYFWLPV